MIGSIEVLLSQRNHDALPLLTPSVDLAWKHGLEFAAALDAGGAGRARTCHPAAGEFATLISGCLGLRF